MEDLSRKALFLAQQAEQQMLGTDMFMTQAFGFFRAIRQHAFAFVAQRKIDRRRYFLPYRGMRLNLLANGFDRSVRAQETIS